MHVNPYLRTLYDVNGKSMACFIKHIQADEVAYIQSQIKAITLIAQDRIKNSPMHQQLRNCYAIWRAIGCHFTLWVHFRILAIYDVVKKGLLGICITTTSEKEQAITIHHLVTHPDNIDSSKRIKGIGTFFVDYLKNKVIADNKRYIIVHALNEAEGFYRKMSFQKYLLTMQWMPN